MVESDEQRVTKSRHEYAIRVSATAIRRYGAVRMSLFLLTYYRDRRRATIVERIDDQSVALAKLFAAETEARSHPEVEVVLLTAADEGDLHRTHSRYFESVAELLAV